MSFLQEAEIIVDGEKSESPQNNMSLTKKCPYCAEDILAQAMKCKHCGSTIAKKSAKPNAFLRFMSTLPTAVWKNFRIRFITLILVLANISLLTFHKTFRGWAGFGSLSDALDGFISMFYACDLKEWWFFEFVGYFVVFYLGWKLWKAIPGYPGKKRLSALLDSTFPVQAVAFAVVLLVILSRSMRMNSIVLALVFVGWYLIGKIPNSHKKVSNTYWIDAVLVTQATLLVITILAWGAYYVTGTNFKLLFGPYSYNDSQMHVLLRSVGELQSQPSLREWYSITNYAKAILGIPLFLVFLRMMKFGVSTKVKKVIAFTLTGLVSSAVVASTLFLYLSADPHPYSRVRAYMERMEEIMNTGDCEKVEEELSAFVEKRRSDLAETMRHYEKYTFIAARRIQHSRYGATRLIKEVREFEEVERRTNQNWFQFARNCPDEHARLNELRKENTDE